MDTRKALAAAARIKKRYTVEEHVAEWEREANNKRAKQKAKRITQEQVRICVEMRKAGFGYEAIHKATGLGKFQAKDAVQRWRKRL